MQGIVRNFLPPGLILGEQELYACQGDIFVLDSNGVLRRRYPMAGLAHLSVQGETMYVAMNSSNDHTIQALDRKDMSVMWSYLAEGRLAASPIVFGEVVFASVVEGYIYALNATDGSLLWRCMIGFFLSASPAVSGEMVYIAQVANGPSVPSVVAVSAKNGQIIWRTPLSESTPWSLTVVENRIYLATRHAIIALNATDGTLLWQSDVEGEAKIYSSPIYSSETVYGYALGTSFGGRRENERVILQREIILFGLDPMRGTVLWKHRVNDLAGVSQVQAFMAVGEQILIATNDGFITALQGADSVPLWRYKAEHGGKLLSLLPGKQDILYVGASDGYVYALHAQDGSLFWQTFIDQSRYVVSAFSHGE